MAFDWIAFLNEYRVPFVERGPNINRTQIGIRCPYCGNADPSEHMAIHRSGGWWRCRRNNNHSGSTPHRLVMQLAACSFTQAQQIVGDQGPARALDVDFAAQVRALAQGPSAVAVEEPAPRTFPAEFKPLTPRGAGRRFWDYLIDRHYTDEQLKVLSSDFGLHYATTGRYAYRVVVPVWTKQGLMSWTGRTIQQREEIRYKSHSAMDYPKDDIPPIANIHDLLLNEHDLDKGGDVLVVAEGPFDGMRLDFFGYPQVRGTCLFSKSISRTQVAKLLNLSPLYHRKWVLLDEDAKMDALAIQSQLERGGWKIKFMEGGKDAAALREGEVKALISSLR